MAGARYERELVNTLGECGYVAMRAPASGAATVRDLPDVLAGRAAETNANHVQRSDRWIVPDGGFYLSVMSEALAIELKTIDSTTAYVGEDEAEDLVRFAEAFGARPLLGVRFKRPGKDRVHYLIPPAEARRTDGGNYGLPAADARERAALVVNATNETVEVVE